MQILGALRAMGSKLLRLVPPEQILIRLPDLSWAGVSIDSSWSDTCQQDLGSDHVFDLEGKSGKWLLS